MMKRDKTLRGLISQQVVLRPLLGSQLRQWGGSRREGDRWFCWGDKTWTEEAISDLYHPIMSIAMQIHMSQDHHHPTKAAFKVL